MGISVNFVLGCGCVMVWVRDDGCQNLTTYPKALEIP